MVQGTKVLPYNFGPYLNNAKLAVQCPTSGKVVYNKEAVTNDFATTPSSLKLMAALISPEGTISSVWDALDKNALGCSAL